MATSTATVSMLPSNNCCSSTQPVATANRPEAAPPPSGRPPPKKNKKETRPWKPIGRTASRGVGGLSCLSRSLFWQKRRRQKTAENDPRAV